MGVAHSTLTAVVLAGVLGLGYYYCYYVTPGGSATSTTDANSVKKSKKKKKKDLEPHKSLEPLSPSTSQLVDSSETIPGQFDQPPLASSSNSKVKKAKKKTSTKQLPAINAKTLPPPSAPAQPLSPQMDTAKSHSGSAAMLPGTEGSWTRVVSKRRQGADEQSSVDVTTSDAGLTSSVTGNSSPVEAEDSTDKPQTLAERLVPKAPQTQVDDMLADHDQPTLARVMRVQPLPEEKPAPGFTWRDYEDVEDADGEDDDGWGVVKGKRSRPSGPSRETNASTAAPSAKTAGGAQQTKRQRQNEKKREAQKAAKAAAERDRLVTLAQHKRELEKTRIIEQSRSAGKTSKVSGGMAPSVDAAGKLVWE